MKTISFGKSATIIDDRTKLIKTVKYKYLNSEIINENEIKVKYVYGELKRRRTYLKRLGFVLKEEVFYNDFAPYASICEIYIKEND